MPEVSIVIPVYNVEEYLEKCLDSVVSQTFTDLEIIIINDGSTDNSLKIAENYAKADGRINLVSQENMGLSGARNRGIDEASGNYILFIDSDDWMDPAMIEKLYKKAIEEDSEITACGFEFFHQADNTSKSGYALGNDLSIESDNERIKIISNFFAGRTGYCVNVWNKLYKMNFIETHKLRFRPTSEIFAEDVAFTFQVLLNLKKLAVVKENLYYYRQWDGSIMKSYKPYLFERFLNLHSYLKQELMKRGYLERISAEFGKYCFKFVMYAMRNEKYAHKKPYDKFKYIRSITRSEIIRESIVKAKLKNFKIKRKLIYPLYFFKQYCAIFVIMVLVKRKA